MTSAKSFPTDSRVFFAKGLAFISEAEYRCCWAEAKKGSPTAVSCQVRSPLEMGDQTLQFLAFAGTAEECLIVVSLNLLRQDCSGGLGRAVTDNGLGKPEAASARLFPVLLFPALRHCDALVSHVDNHELKTRRESEKQLMHYEISQVP